MTESKKFYVYLYRDPRPGKDFQPIYVGKGLVRTRRAYIHWEKRARCSVIMKSVLNKIEAAGLYPLIEILLYTDSQIEAHALEVELIARYGRRYDRSGSLCNMTIGGEGTAGLSWTDSQRSKIIDKLNAPAALEANRQRMLSQWNTPEIRALRCARIKESLSSPAVRAKLRQAIIESRTGEVRARIGASAKKRWQDPEHRAQLIAARKATFAKPDVKAARSKISKAMWADPAMHDKIAARISEGLSTPENKARQSKRSKAYYADPARRAEAGAFAAKYNTPEVRAQKGADMKARWADPEFKATMIAGRKMDRDLKLIREALHARRPTHMEPQHV